MYMHIVICNGKKLIVLFKILQDFDKVDRRALQTQIHSVEYIP